jgi:hypothetical protein
VWLGASAAMLDNILPKLRDVDSRRKLGFL